MGRFRFEATNEEGRQARGTLSAQSENDLAEQLKSRGWKLLTAELREEQLHWSQRLARGYFSFLFQRVGARSLAVWYRSLGYLIGAGMGLSGAAHALAEKSDNRTLGAVSREIAEAAGQGRRPTTVLQRHPGVFPAFARAVIETGEETGLLEQTCKKMAEFYDQMYELQLAYRAQGFYPALLLAAYVVIPAVPALVLDGFGAFAVMVISSTWHTALFLIALLLVWRALVQFRGCAEAIDRLKLSLPWLGSVFRRTALSRWARAMAMLFSAGVAMGKAVETAASACGNAAIEAAIRREASGILKGQPLSEVMKATGEFPNTAVEMVAVGEQSGEVDKVLARLAGYYETEVMAAQKQAAVSVGAGFYLLVVFLIGIYVIRFWTGYYGQLPRPGT